MTGRRFVCQSKRFEQEFPFRAVQKEKDKTEWDKQYLSVFSSAAIFRQSEQGRKVFFSVLTPR